MIKIPCLGGDYLLERGLLQHAGEVIALSMKPQKVLIISDRNVFPLYGPALMESFKGTNIEVMSIVFAAGEKSKTFNNAIDILSNLSKENFSRSDVLISLGGGVMGDLGGFAASCFKRGMKFVQIPTSLLAMVDSSVGGKTGINLGSAKNQVGTFYQPSITIADPQCLEALPSKEYRCGCAEVIKYAVLFDSRFFDSLLETPANRQYEKVIEKCVTFKRNIVIEDERDSGIRHLLNFGHTIGHAIEAKSGYKIAHGEAVAMGMAAISQLAFAHGYCQKDCVDSIYEILHKYQLPISSDYTMNDLYKIIRKDKKSTAEGINFIIPERIGKCMIKNIAYDKLWEFLNTGAGKWI